MARFCKFFLSYCAEGFEMMIIINHFLITSKDYLVIYPWLTLKETEVRPNESLLLCNRSCFKTKDRLIFVSLPHHFVTQLINEKQLVMATAMYLEHYLDSLESLPTELKRNFTLMADLDTRAQVLAIVPDSPHRLWFCFARFLWRG